MGNEIGRRVFTIEKFVSLANKILKKPETSTNSTAYNLPERGGCMKEEPVIENFIEIDGKDILIDSLPDEDRKRIGLLIQDRMMELAGYRRKAASD